MTPMTNNENKHHRNHPKLNFSHATCNQDERDSRCLQLWNGLINRCLGCWVGLSIKQVLGFQLTVI